MDHGNVGDALEAAKGKIERADGGDNERRRRKADLEDGRERCRTADVVADIDEQQRIDRR